MSKKTDKVALREELAELSHDQWSGWTRYMLGKCEPSVDGGLYMPAECVKRWTRQMDTHYSFLPEEEKASDRVEADRVLNLLEGHLR